MAQVLAAVPAHGLEAVLVAVELALEAGKPSGEHVLNVLSRLKQPMLETMHANVHTGMQTTVQANNERGAAALLKLKIEPQADVARYEALRVSGGKQ
jgi:hypothetical protein